MTDATDLWAAVEASYDAKGLTLLTNVRDRSATTADDTVGADAAAEVLALWPAYAQIDYDSADALHIAAAKQGVIALLWRRGGSAANIGKVRWDEVFGPDGIVSKIRQTDAREHRNPETNSGVSQPSELSSSGQAAIPWSHPDALPGGRSYMPRRAFSD